MLFYTTFARRTFTASLNELFENYTGRHTHVYSGRMTRLKYPPCTGTQLNSAGEITITIEEQDLYNSYLLVEGDVVKADGTRYEDLIALTNDGHVFGNLFSRVC